MRVTPPYFPRAVPWPIDMVTSFCYRVINLLREKLNLSGDYLQFMSYVLTEDEDFAEKS